MRAVEDALLAHFESTLDEDDNEARSGAVIVDWIAGYTISNIVDVEGRAVVGFHNEYVSPDTNPNAQAHLALWVHREVAGVLEGDEE